MELTWLRRDETSADATEMAIPSSILQKAFKS